MRIKLKTIKEFFLNLSLVKKMFILFAIAGLIPLCISFIISYIEIYELSANTQSYMLNHGYSQIRSALSNQLRRISRISITIAGNQNINRSLMTIKNSDDFYERLTAFQSMNENLNELYNSEEYDNIMYFVNSDLNIGEDKLQLFRSSYTSEGEEIKSKLDANGDKPLWMFFKDNSTYRLGSYLSLGRYVMDFSNYNNYIGILMINIDLNKIKDNFILTTPDELVYLRANTGEFITSNNDKVYEEMHITQSIMKQMGSNFSEIMLNNKAYMGCRSIIPDTNLELVSIIPKNSFNKSLFFSGKKMIPLYIFICFSMLMIIYTLAKSISKRILLLSKKMKGVQKGNFEKLEIKEQKDEVGNLITNYNYMINEIDSLLAKEFELGQEKKGAELKALQSQINPHFLYNTLDMISWMAQKNENENIKSTVQALSKYYRLILNKGKDIITIGDEIELCKAYIAIQQKRFNDRINFEIDVEDEIKSYLIPKITLQPLIENAIIHGISESQSGRGTIIISGWEDKEYLILSVTDDGVGMDTDKGIEKKHSGSGYGISNIEMRLTMFYNMPKCINYESIKEVGTCVSLKIKKIKN